MLFTNIFTIAAVATAVMAGYTGPHRANGGSHVAAAGNKGSADKPGHSFAAREEGVHHHQGFMAKDGSDDPEGIRARPHGNHTLEARHGGVYWCTKDNWRGTCHKSAADNTCQKWPYGPAGSFGPDPGVHCTFYDIDDCRGDTTSVSYPGTGQVYFYGKGLEYYVPEAWKCSQLL